MQALVSSPSGKLVDAPLNGEFEIKLSGEKSGYKFRIDINTLWDKKGSYDHLDARQRFYLVAIYEAKKSTFSKVTQSSI